MKTKILTLFLALVVSVSFANAEVYNGTCGAESDGANLRWEVNSVDSTLTITGSGAMQNWSQKTNVPWNAYNRLIKYITLPKDLTSIGSYAFAQNSNFKSIVIPENVVSIGEYAFDNSWLTSVVWNARNCTLPSFIPATPFYSSHYITSFVIGDNVESIPAYLCYDMDKLTSLVVPNSVSSIGKFAFRNVANVQYTGAASGAPWGARTVNGFVEGDFVFSDATKTTLTACMRQAKGDVHIPSSVETIGDYAFKSCYGVTSIEMTDNVISIGKHAFDHSDQITSIRLSNSITSIQEGIFCGCHSLLNVAIPNGVTSIGGGAFMYCYKLKSIEIPNTVNEIGGQAFRECKKLESIHIPEGISTIKTCTFLQCYTLTSIILPNSVTIIEDEAFSACTSLEKVVMGDGITRIGTCLFGDNSYVGLCKSLKTIVIYTVTPPKTADHRPFGIIPDDVVIYVPFGSKEAYKGSKNWGDLQIESLYDEKLSSASTSAVLEFSHNLWAFDNNYIASVSIEGGETFDGNTLELIGLEPNKEFNDISVVLTSNTGETEKLNVSFTTTALELTTQPSKPVSSNTAILLAETNMADSETSCGFEWKRNDAPEDMAPNKVFAPVANGTLAGRLKNLKDDVYYKYRAFYQSAAGNMYYGEWQYIFTGDVAVEFDPILYTYAATAVKENEATLKGYALAGSDDFTEQGFEYWADSRLSNGGNAPARMKADLGEHKTVTASGISMKVTLQDLDEGTVYKYRTYAKIGDKVLYGTLMSFTTLGEFEQGLEELREESHSSAHKFLRNGQLYILRDGKIYNVTGVRVK